MTLLQNPSSECADCGLCWRAKGGLQPDVEGDVDRIIREVVRRLDEDDAGIATVPVGVSARHCHLNVEAMDALFGSGSEQTPMRDLYQPGAFAAEQSVSVVGPRMRAIERVRILGPARDYNQVELARTDAIYLGVDPPVRDSGDLDGAVAITFIGPRGAVTADAAIRATRHIHMRPSDLEAADLEPHHRVNVRVGGEKGLIYHNVRLKVAPDFLPELHLDTDDANAADLVCGDTVSIERSEQV